MFVKPFWLIYFKVIYSVYVYICIKDRQIQIHCLLMKNKLWILETNYYLMSRVFLIPLPFPLILGNYTMINVHIFSLFILVIERKYCSGRTNHSLNYLLWERSRNDSEAISFWRLKYVNGPKIYNNLGNYIFVIRGCASEIDHWHISKLKALLKMQLFCCINW